MGLAATRQCRHASRTRHSRLKSASAGASPSAGTWRSPGSGSATFTCTSFSSCAKQKKRQGPGHKRSAVEAWRTPVGKAIGQQRTAGEQGFRLRTHVRAACNGTCMAQGGSASQQRSVSPRQPRGFSLPMASGQPAWRVGGCTCEHTGKGGRGTSGRQSGMQLSRHKGRRW